MDSIADTIDTTGQEPYEQCGYCHEYDGNSLMPGFPRLAGQTPEYIDKQLRDFRSGKRHGQMQATAELLSDADIKIVASYFSQQPVVTKSVEPLPPKREQLAAELVHQGDSARDLPACVSCHQDRTLGAGTVPRLAGQHPPYLLAQLKAFRNGARSNDVDGQMQRISRQLTEQEIRLLARYLAALPASTGQHGQAN